MSKKVIAIYSRKSKFTGKGESTENQIELCRGYINSYFDDESEIFVYEDMGYSGGNLDRPQFKRMMRDCEEGKISSIVCYRLDRISRNIGDFANLISELEGLGVSFISIREQFDTSSPMGRAMMYIASVFSQLERETIGERIKDNMKELSKTGRWLGGVTPTGYRSVCAESRTDSGRIKKRYNLELIDEEAKIVLTIFDRYLETKSFKETARYLNGLGVKTKNKNDFTPKSVKNILTNPVYMSADMDCYNYLIKNRIGVFSDEKEFDGKRGIVVYNRSLQKKGKAQKIRPVDEWICAVGEHVGIIPGEKWIEVQKVILRNKRNTQ